MAVDTSTCLEVDGLRLLLCRFTDPKRNSFLLVGQPISICLIWLRMYINRGNWVLLLKRLLVHVNHFPWYLIGKE